MIYLNRDDRGFSPELFDYLVATLNQLLEDAGSAYRAKVATGLTRRVDETAHSAAEQAEKDAHPDASQHLRTAWRAAYGLHPDPTKAYSGAIKAVEAVSIPIVLPNGAFRNLRQSDQAS
jgi:uncharacterized protein YmfQ (DUF2313 family)